MNAENENNETKFCPYCAEEIRQAAIKCKHCGEFLNEPQNIDAPKSVDVPINDSNSKLENKRPVNSKMITSDLGRVMLLIGAIITHFLFCGESPLINPLYPFVQTLAYCIPGILASIIVFTPIIAIMNKETGEGFFRGVNWNSINKALWIGAIIRFLFFWVSVS